MFDISDRDTIQLLIDSKMEESSVTPICFKVYNKYYTLFDYEELTSFDKNNVKVVFGGRIHVLDKNKFPKSFVNEFGLLLTFSTVDENTGVVTQYYAIEISRIDDTKDDPVKEMMNQYIDCVISRLQEHTEKKRKELIDKMLSEN